MISAGVNVNTVPAAVAAIIIIIAAITAVYLTVRSSYAKAQIDALRGDRDDLTTRATRLETEKSNLEALYQAERVKREALEAIVTGKNELHQVIILLSDHDRRVARIGKIVERIDENTDPAKRRQ